MTVTTDPPTNPSELLERIQRALANSTRAEDSKFLDVAAAVEQMPGIEALARLSFRHHEYVIRMGMMAQLELTVAALQKVAPWALVSAPEVVACLPAGAPFGVLITRYGACPGERLRSAVGQPLGDAAVQQLRQDLQTLADHGLVHEYARGLHHCLVSSVSGRLLLDDWQALRQGSPAEAAEVLERLDWAVTRQRQVLQRRASLAVRPRTAEVFGAERVLLPVVHPVSRQAALDNVELVVQAGCAGLFLINQGMSQRDVLELVMEIRSGYPSLWVGVNLIGLSPAAALTTALDACEGRIDGLWTDDAGIDEWATVQPAAEALLKVRRSRDWQGLYFGGVAFKHQRRVHDADLAAAARCAAPLMDVVCTSGAGTGQAAAVEKLRALRDALGPGVGLALASGVNQQNLRDYLPYVNAFLVGTGVESSFGVLDRIALQTIQRLISERVTFDDQCRSDEDQTQTD